MITDEAELLKSFYRGRGGTSGSRHNPVVLISLLDTIPKRFITGLDDFSRRARQITEHILGETSLDALVTAVELGPGFFEQDDPKLITSSLGEGWVILPAWDEVIDYHFLPVSIFANPKAVDAQIILLIVNKKLLDS